MTTPFIVGIAGPKGCGKTTFATALDKELLRLNVLCSRVGFATKMKQALHIMFGGKSDNWFGSDEDKNQPSGWGAALGEKYSTYRRILQTFGTDIVRNNISDRFWIDALDNTISTFLAGVVIIDDVRFDNEAEYIRKNGGLIFHYRRRSNTEHADPDQHVSEAGVKVSANDDLVLYTQSIEDMQYAASTHAVHIAAELRDRAAN